MPTKLQPYRAGVIVIVAAGRRTDLRLELPAPPSVQWAFN